MVTIDKLSLKGFGRFSNASMELSPGLNVIYGGNEAGKSTLHRFIEAMLFGFWAPNMSRPQREKHWDNCQPWKGSVFAGELVYTWSEGRVLVRRDFAVNTVEVIDADSGDRLAGIPVNSWGEPDFARAHWGCSKLVFRNTVSISQLGTVTDSALVTEVKNVINNLAQSGGSGVSVDSALEALRAVEKNKLAHLIDQAREQWQQLAEQLEASRRLHKEACQLELEKLRLNLELENYSREYEETQRRKEQAKAAAARRRLARLEEFQAKQRTLEVELAQLASAKPVDDKAVEEARHLQSQLDAARKVMAEHTAAEGEAVRAYRDVADKLEALAAYREYSKDTAVEISSACQILKKSREAVAQHQQQLEHIVSEVQRVTAQLATLPYFRPDTLDQAATLQRQAEGTQIHGSQQELEQQLNQLERGAAVRKFFRGTMLLAFPAIAVAAWLFTPLLGAAAVLPLVTVLLLNGEIRKTSLRCRALRREIYALDMEFHNSQRQREQAQRELEALLAKAGVRDITELEAKFRQFASLSEQNRELLREQKYIRSKLENYEKEAAASEEQLKEFFTRAGLDPTDLEEALSQFRAKLDQMLELKTVVEQRQQQAEAARSRLDQARLQVTGIEEKLGELLKRYGAKTSEELASMAADIGTRKQLAQQVEEIKQQIADLLAGTSLDQLQQQAAAAADATDEPDGPVEETDAGHSLHQLQARISQIDGRLEGIYAGLKPIAELEEAVEQARNQYRRCQMQKDALELAGKEVSRLAEELSDQLAPELNHRVSKLVERITGGRYRDINVGADMSIDVATPESSQPVPLDKLSGGTVDQFYFACRVAVADLVTNNAGLPLLLDDSFVQYDDDRLERMLALLTEMGSERQIILFTCQQRELETLARLAPDQHNLVRLEVRETRE